MSDFELFGTSPSTVTAPTLLDYNARTKRDEKSDIRLQQPTRLSLEEFIRELPQKIAHRKDAGISAGSKEDPIMELFSRLELQAEEWKPYALQDLSRSYTRNLIATDNACYTLLLLCWNPGQFSPIHDHPCDGCWMKVLEGQVQECRYRPAVEGAGAGAGADSDTCLVCTQDVTAVKDDLVYIEDSLGFHKVGNPSPTEAAFTLHLYSPPFQRCKIWLNETTTSVCTFRNYSEFGKKLA